MALLKRMLALPCEKGDTVYIIPGYFNRRVAEAVVIDLRWSHYGGWKIVAQEVGMEGNKAYIWGKHVFATRSKAESVLRMTLRR